MEYPKINSLYKREGWYFDEDIKNNPAHQKGRQSLIIGDYARPEFGCIKRWQLQEKIDGMNIRVHMRRVELGPTPDQPIRYMWIGPEYHGRRGDSMLPASLVHELDKIFKCDRMQEFLNNHGDLSDAWFFGEGYGPKIQKGGGNYRKDQGFILFDVVWNGQWSAKEWVMKNAEELGIPYAPYIGVMSEEEMVEYVKSKPLSLCSITPQVMEGVIARPEYPLYLPHGAPLMMKLKVKDMVHAL